MKSYITDTIVAQATSIGRGSVGIVRVSGPNALAIAQLVTQQQHFKTRFAHLRDIYIKSPTGSDQKLDQALTIFFKAPFSFTGEDIIEFQTHGGQLILQTLQEYIVSTGLARYAKPGEFTEQAFLNGKMDLSQAEAVSDLIEATSLQAITGALNSLEGAFSTQIHEIVDDLTFLRAHVEASIDFPDEELDLFANEHIRAKIFSIRDKLQAIKGTAKQGKILRDGMSVVIVGQPNAGKSSLLNALAGTDTAIVTEIAGTTRDTLKEFIQIDGLPLHIIDTAGLRQTTDRVELIGIERAYQAVSKADAIIIVSESQDFTIEKALLPPETFSKGIPEIFVTNKIDLMPDATPWCRQQGQEYFIGLSAEHGLGLDALKQTLKTIIGYQNTGEGAIIARQRHIQAIDETIGYFNNVMQYLKYNDLPELVADDLRMAQNKLGEITGKFTSDDLLTVVFSSFCIGK